MRKGNHYQYIYSIHTIALFLNTDNPSIIHFKAPLKNRALKLAKST